MSSFFLPPDHPFNRMSLLVGMTDCVADVPTTLLVELERFYGHEEPPDAVVPAEELR